MPPPRFRPRPGPLRAAPAPPKKPCPRRLRAAKTPPPAAPQKALPAAAKGRQNTAPSAAPPAPLAAESALDSDDDFYTPGSPALAQSRAFLLQESVARARVRVAREKAQAAGHNATKTLRHRRGIAARAAAFALHGSYTMAGNLRQLSRVRYSRSGTAVACSLWAGHLHLLHKDSSGFYRETHRLAPGHHAQMATVAWSPGHERLLVLGGAEGCINVWHAPGAADTTALLPAASTKHAHGARVAQTAFHPGGTLYASASHDHTWKLWDVARPARELVEQEGHAGEVHLVAFHPDGGLAATGGLDAHALLWDLRSGRRIAAFEGHAQGVYSMDFSPNGRHLATASGDHLVRLWDLRRPGAELFVIPAHTRLVSDVRFVGSAAGFGAAPASGGSEWADPEPVDPERADPERVDPERADPERVDPERALSSPLPPQHRGLAEPVTDDNDAHPETLPVAGTCLVTSSYDNTVKVWSADNWVHIKTLHGHTDRVLSCDIRSDGAEILSCGWDRTMRAWGLGDA
ncbi:WD40 repeat-like protein [Metschnikowia bicuspidata var. bicuspidata NRRL YB-4993]|uniref:WD40 repeat-like protein n=1 Tax=Metschnikowia bicuspidata var. bicuspidata NRRL YB-4993 TaxID=869754 RepID=A0A1A0HJQ3_9ASCO|nr:WD40 repeat-like protein [Metschnikowia bicuspidata var. bicuspidata NRRL YB-4993]OBA24122.1 WD40 repeat-like protein [Metschnikowia bicuspidata var. bicuspidata NRRL YB-4993]